VALGDEKRHRAVTQRGVEATATAVVLSTRETITQDVISFVKKRNIRPTTTLPRTPQYVVGTRHRHTDPTATSLRHAMRASKPTSPQLLLDNGKGKEFVCSTGTRVGGWEAERTQHGAREQPGTSQTVGGGPEHHTGQHTLVLPPPQRTVHAEGPATTNDLAGTRTKHPEGQLAPVLSSQQTMMHAGAHQQADRAAANSTDAATHSTPWPRFSQDQLTGLRPPRLSSGSPVVGHGARRHRRENKATRKGLQEAQEQVSYWSQYSGGGTIPTPLPNPTGWRGQMCPQNLALHHPAAATLLQYATGGCPVLSGQPWSLHEIEAAIARGNHASALSPAAVAFHASQLEVKLAEQQCRVVAWDEIKHNHPAQLKVSPLAMVPHKSRAFRAILDLSFPVRLADDSTRASVNWDTEKTAPAGAIDQLGHTLSRVIHALADVDDEAKVFFAKFDIKDGFWRLNAADGDEWNFCYVLPQPPGAPILLVVPTSLQMGWVESPAYFCAASETGRDVAAQYAERDLGSLTPHKFHVHTTTHDDFQSLPTATDDKFSYFLDCYVDDYLSMAVATSQQQLNHISTALMNGVHDVFPPASDDDQDSLSLKKLKRGEGAWALRGDVLGFSTYGGVGPKSIWLAEDKRDKLLVILHRWIRAGRTGHSGVEFSEFRSVVAKIRHAFVAIPNGIGLLSPCNAVLRKEPPMVFFHRNKPLLEAVVDIRVLLRESICAPTLCRELVTGWPDYVAIVDASGHGVGIVVVGEVSPCIPTVARFEWPKDIKDSIVSEKNPTGTITNSDLETAGALLAWLVVEGVCTIPPGTHVAIYSDNEATVTRMVKRKSRARIAAHLVRALSLRLKFRQASPLSPLHIPGKQNMITDVPSRSFGSVPAWHWKSLLEFQTHFNSMFPLPSQHSWAVFVLSYAICMKVVCVLRMQASTLDAWRRLPRIGRYIGATGPALFGLWEWTHTWRTPHSRSTFASSQPLQDSSELGSLVMDERSRLQRSLRTSRPLARRSVWPATKTPQK